ncbi:hypothetical protein LDENG_00094430 [Lucifuga dentata]|nr:hypothetical protein LDENG_00094430 [Lucifuga dentata]
MEPVLMAYDRPSPKFLSFLAKHYCLTKSVPQVNNFVVFEGFFVNRSVAQMRKVPPKKPDGEIKPYSLMERDVVHQEQRALPWPFAPPLSPQQSQSVSSPCSRSLSVGSYPSRASPQASPTPVPGVVRGQTPRSPLINSCRTRRTSQHGLVARCSLYSRHMDGNAVRLLDRQLSGPSLSRFHLSLHPRMSASRPPYSPTQQVWIRSLKAVLRRTVHVSCCWRRREAKEAGPGLWEETGPVASG